MSEKENNFVTLASINVGSKIEKKGSLSYLSWAWAVDQLMRADPAANWAYSEPTIFAGDTMMVHCTVTAFGKPMTAHLPVMDNRNKPIQSPDAFSVNTAMQRCLVKAIALHGLGLYIYAGEDLPASDEPESKAKPHGALRPGDGSGKISAMAASEEEFNALDAKEQEFLRETAANMTALYGENRVSTAYDLFVRLDEEEKLAIWHLFGSKERSAFKAEGDARKEKQAA